MSTVERCKNYAKPTLRRSILRKQARRKRVGEAAKKDVEPVTSTSLHCSPGFEKGGGLGVPDDSLRRLTLDRRLFNLSPAWFHVCQVRDLRLASC